MSSVEKFFADIQSIKDSHVMVGRMFDGFRGIYSSYAASRIQMGPNLAQFIFLFRQTNISSRFDNDDTFNIAGSKRIIFHDNTKDKGLFFYS